MTDIPQEPPSLTFKRAAILTFLVVNCHRAHTPTEIGKACGETYETASSWACRGLKWLVKHSLVSVPSRGKYKATRAGQEVIRLRAERAVLR